MFADMARIQKESYCKKKKIFPTTKKCYFYFRQQEFMKAAIINRIVVACSCNNNFLTKMFFFFFCSPLQFSFLGQIYKNRSTKRQKRSSSQKVSKSDYEHNDFNNHCQETSETQVDTNGKTTLSTQVILEN